MRLEKWYADVVEGERLTVHYLANLSLGPLAFRYRGELRQDTRSAVFGLGRETVPHIEAARLRLGNDGSPAWRDPVSRPIQLWTDGRRHITWNPLVLNGAVEGATPGRGYAEQLVMTAAPWRLGLSRLWWGRFCGRRHSLVWIVWEGRHPLRLVLFDGERIRLDGIAPDAVRAAPDVALRLYARQPLVNQPLGVTLADMPWAKRIAPLSFLAGRERKWFAEGALQIAGQDTDHGAVVCETVDWP